ncbi:unnamed protein product, partial [Ectocarpus sp. 8 AP-2014]
RFCLGNRIRRERERESRESNRTALLCLACGGGRASRGGTCRDGGRCHIRLFPKLVEEITKILPLLSCIHYRYRYRLLTGVNTRVGCWAAKPGAVFHDKALPSYVFLAPGLCLLACCEVCVAWTVRYILSCVLFVSINIILIVKQQAGLGVTSPPTPPEINTVCVCRRTLLMNILVIIVV